MAYAANNIDQFSNGMPRKTGSLIAKRLPSHGNRVWAVSVEPAIEPISADDVKTFARIDYDAEDTLIEGFITAVRIAAEEYLGMAFIEQTIEMKMDYWPDAIVYLPQPPLISITKIATLDEDDTETEYSSDNYYTILQGNPGKVVLKKDSTAPQNTDRYVGGFLIRYKAGYGDETTDVPGSIRNGLMAWAAIVQATRIIDTKNPPPEAKVFFDLYKRATMVIR